MWDPFLQTHSYKNNIKCKNTLVAKKCVSRKLTIKIANFKGKYQFCYINLHVVSDARIIGSSCPRNLPPLE